VDHFPAEEEEREHSQEGEPGSKDRAAEGLIDAAVDQVRQLLSLVEVHIFPDPVEHYDGVVHRVAHQRQQRSDHRQRDLFIQQGKDTDRDDDVMKRRNDRCDAVD